MVIDSSADTAVMERRVLELFDKLYNMYACGPGEYSLHSVCASLAQSEACQSHNLKVVSLLVNN